MLTSNDSGPVTTAPIIHLMRSMSARKGAISISMLRIPRQTGHRFHGKLDTHSTANWTVSPAQTGHRFHSKLDSLKRSEEA